MTSEGRDENLSGRITDVDQASVTVAGVMLLFEAPLPSEPTNVQVLRRLDGGVEHIAISAEVQDVSGQIRQRRWETRMSGEMRFPDELT